MMYVISVGISCRPRAAIISNMHVIIVVNRLVTEQRRATGVRRAIISNMHVIIVVNRLVTERRRATGVRRNAAARIITARRRSSARGPDHGAALP